jgi:hypothetical protein
MNKVSAISLIMYAGLALYVATLFFLFFTGQNIPQQVAWIGIAAAPYIFMIHTAFWFFFPKESRLAFDEQTTETERRSQAFGYFAALATFLICLALVLIGTLKPSTAYWFMGFSLVIPSIYMIFAHFSGRAG